MRKIPHFCRALEQIAGLQAITVVWQRAMGDDWTWARGLLRPTDSLAEAYPQLRDDGLPSYRSYRVVCHSEVNDDYVGVLDDHEPISLSRADLVIHELDTGALATRVGDAMDVEREFALVAPEPATYRLGSSVRNASTTPVAVYLCLPSIGERLEVPLLRLHTSHTEEREVLIVPTRRRRMSAENVLMADGMKIISLEEQVFVDSRGAFSPIDLPALVRPRPLAAAVDAIRADGCYGRDVVYNGQTYTCNLTRRQADFFSRAMHMREMTVYQFMNPKDGLSFHERYSRAKRNRVSKFLSLLNDELSRGSPALPFQFSLQRDSDMIFCDPPVQAGRNAIASMTAR